jgi:hypothetical protein
VECGVEYTDQFEEWWNGLDSAEQEDVAAKVGLLEEYGPALGRPYRVPIGCMSNISTRCGAKIERAAGRNDDG